MKAFRLYFILFFISCNTRSISQLVENEIATYEDSVEYHKLDLALEGDTLKLMLKRGAKKTIIEFPFGGTQTDVVITKGGMEVGSLKYFIGDTINSNKFVLFTDSSNKDKREFYQASYTSCSQFGSYTILIN